jgi:hypothetical protein
MRNSWTLAAVFAVVSLNGCSLYGGDDDESLRCLPHEPGAVDPAGMHEQFVVNAVYLPTTATSSNQFAFDLDADPQGRPDNMLGAILSIADWGGYDLNAESQMLVDAGEILHLLDVHTSSIDDAEDVGVTLAHAYDLDGDPSDNFSGVEDFGIDSTRGSGTLTGTVTNGRLVVDVGTVPLAVTFPGLDEPFILELRGARMEATFTEDGLEGRIGGAMSPEVVNGTVVPLFHEGLGRIVDSDCVDGVCPDGSFARTLLDLFDDDKDGSISLEELRENTLTSALFSSDVDMFDEDGNLAPGCDGVADSLSVAVGFDAVPARFVPQ